MTRGGWVVVILLMLAVSCCDSAAEGPEDLQRAIRSTTDQSALAILYKQLGDRYVLLDDLPHAADAYITALDLRREAFPARERLRIAVYLSWADRLTRSQDEVRAILAEEPENLAARVHLARVLSWNGELTAAIEEAEKVLEQSPANRDALLVKADSLQWKGQLRKAIAIYKGLLATHDDFDSRVGLSYAYLAAGDKTAAEDGLRLLAPLAAGRQQRTLRRLSDQIAALTSPTVELRYSYYSDSDGNRLDRYILSSRLWMRNFDLGASVRLTDARDNIRGWRPAEDLTLKLYTNWTESFGIGGGVGFTAVGDDHTAVFPTGYLKADAKLWNGTIGVSIQHEVFSETAQLIDNRIRMTTVSLRLSQSLTDRLVVNARYDYKSFSDTNYAHDGQVAVQYLVLVDPKIGIGYRLRLLDFNRQSGSGYFDPSDYLSNRFFTSLYVDKGHFYIYSEVFAGQQLFRRNGFPTRSVIAGGSASLGLKPTRKLSLEFSVEGGSFGPGTVSGYSYLVLGPWVLFRF